LKIKYLKLAIPFLFVAMVVPYILYFINFSGSLHGNEQSWANFGNFIGGVITSVFSFTSFLILFINFIYDKEKVNKDRTIEYLKHVNIFYADISDVYQNIEIIRQLSGHLLENEYEKYEIVINNDYSILKIFNKIEILQKYLNENENNYNDEEKKIIFKLIVSKINEILDPYIFKNKFEKFTRNAINYYYLIDKNLRDEYNKLIEIIIDFSANAMDKFNIAEYVEIIDQHIISINENILNTKIDRKKDI